MVTTTDGRSRAEVIREILEQNGFVKDEDLPKGWVAKMHKELKKHKIVNTAPSVIYKQRQVLKESLQEATGNMSLVTNAATTEVVREKPGRGDHLTLSDAKAIVAFARTVGGLDRLASAIETIRNLADSVAGSIVL